MSGVQNNGDQLISNEGQNALQQGEQIAPDADYQQRGQQQFTQQTSEPTGQLGSISEGPPPAYYEADEEPDDVVQVVYQNDSNGRLVGVETSLLSGNQAYEGGHNRYGSSASIGLVTVDEADSASHQQQQLSRSASTLPPVAEESSITSGAGADYPPESDIAYMVELDSKVGLVDEGGSILRSSSENNGNFQDEQGFYPSDQLEGCNSAGQYSGARLPHQSYTESQSNIMIQQPLNPIYSVVTKQTRSGNRVSTFGYVTEDIQPGCSASVASGPIQDQQTTGIGGSFQPSVGASDGATSLYSNPSLYNQSTFGSEQRAVVLTDSNFASNEGTGLVLQTKPPNTTGDQQTSEVVRGGQLDENADELPEKENIGQEEEDFDEEIDSILARHKQGAAESGSFRNNFKKKLGISVSTNEDYLTAHRKKLLESQVENGDSIDAEDEDPGDLPSGKFKRTHSVSFNVGAKRAGRHSVDIRNLPSYLTVKRASIVDVAKGAMSSLMHSFGGGTGSIGGSQPRRDSSPDEEPIFEEPIAPTLSLGQRVALVKNSGAEFGTVGWIGQLPDVDDDWIVGVIFDNMIGDCDGAHNGVRYFYSRQNYAMFVPLSTLTKTDNYIGRPETGTMLSRMSVSLKPGQLISIQRSSIRLQHCFLNAPHQRVGHDVRAVSNRLHCQCHNCGPCAHLTKQGRVAIPPFGAHHAPNKKNSLAHAAVEILAHHHHHYHEEEHKEEVDYQFGDNAAHACNFVRYSCCQQNGTGGHQFSADCNMVRPELLDNLIHAPKAPHRRSRPPRARRNQHQSQVRQQQVGSHLAYSAPGHAIQEAGTDQTPVNTLDGTMKSWTTNDTSRTVDSRSSYSSCSSSRSSSPASGDDRRRTQQQNQLGHPAYHQASSVGLLPTNEFSAYNPPSDVYSTIDTRMSLSDQQRFIYQRESSVFVRSRPQSSISDESKFQGDNGFGSSIRRCFACLTGRKTRSRSHRPKKRKMSARNRMIEYRRKQSTFVPSTLAKPHEDFASQGITFPNTSQQSYHQQTNQHDSNSDYSSYSKSSCSSRSNSPPNGRRSNQANNTNEGQQVGAIQQTQTMFMEHEIPNTFDQLKSSHTFQGTGKQPGELNYDDYTFSDGHESSKKIGLSSDPTLTDLGYFDGYTNSSSDTLKHIVDQSINEQVSLPLPIVYNGDEAEEQLSPISSCNCSNPSEQIEISSPTVSLVEGEDQEAVREAINGLNINDNNDETSS